MKKFAFKGKERLKKDSRFKDVYKKGSVCKSEGANLYYLTNSLKLNRLGILVKKGCAERSWQRNRIKRLLREAYRLNKGKFKKGYDLVILVKNVRPDYSGLERELLKLVKGAGLI